MYNYAYNLYWLYAMRFFSSLIPAYVIERLYWEERGMTIQMVIYTEIIFAATVILCELPSGIAADRWGRWRLLLLAGILGCAEFLLLVFAENFWHFAVVVLLAGIGRSASSGAEQAMLYESLLAQGRERHYERHVGRLHALDITATVIAALSGSVLASLYGFTFNYWLSLTAAALALLFACLLREPPRAIGGEEPEEAPMPIRAYVVASLRFFRRQPQLCLVLLSAMIIGAAVNFIDEFWQLYLDRVGIPVLYFGLVSAGIYALRLPGSLLAYLLKGKVTYRMLLGGVLALMVTGFAWLAAGQGISGLAAIALICLASGFLEPLVSGYMQHRADPAMRATLGSFHSLGEHAAVMLSGLGFGYWAGRADVFGGFGFVAVMCAVYLVMYMVVARRVLNQ
ncbi:MFS transporter [Paenibacillus daejeonensis]|uniref:MFS transporter n=1 Tax=Paenibacillus daejeonensis TaxID=135193 RepID=UPI000367FF36|nr:MFS transporter [Paenibacillus daejeonensis]